jgi:PKD repeat protein
MWTILLRPADTTPPANQPPTARFTFGCTGLVCDFDGSTSSDPEEDIVSWGWDFDDELAGTGATTAHAYEEPGTYDVTLTVTDGEGLTHAITQPVSVGQATTAVEFVGHAASNRNSTAFTATVPSAVEADDLLLLFVSQNNLVTLTGPGSGWTQVGRVADSSHVTTVWQRVATTSDAGSTVRLASGATYTKVALTLAAYRGTSTTDPVAVLSGAPQAGTTAAHTTPIVSNDTPGAWRVSYWSDKSSATTAWSDPTGETRRAVTAGAGGGRVSSLLTDAGGPLTAGSPTTTGGLVATADAATDKATTWTLLLRPAG